MFQPLGPGGGEFANISGYSSSQGPLFTQSATQNGLIYYPNTTNYTLTGLPAPTGPGVLRLDAVADLDLGSEFLSLVAEGIGLGSAFVSGGAQMSLATTASQMGGNVRVGLEDSLFISRGQLAESNAQQVAKIRRIVEDLGSQVATPDEAREILDLKGGDRVAF